jgi:adiponectin receptor
LQIGIRSILEKEFEKNISLHMSDVVQVVPTLHRRKSSLGSHHDVLIDEDHKYILANHFLKKGYRMNYSPVECALSLFHMHNETFNVWTHLGGAALFLYFFICAASPDIFPEGIANNSWIYPPPPQISFLSPVPLLMFLGCALFCFTASALFHLLQAMNNTWFIYLLRLDFTGIAVCLMGCYLPILYCFFLCQPTVMLNYMGGVLVFGSILVVALMSEKMAMEKYRTHRMAFFLSVTTFGIVPIIHAIFFSDSLEGIIMSFITKYMFTHLWFLFGATIFLFRFPESAYPGRFDFYLSSHQIWHTAVFMAVYTHYCNVHDIYEWREANLCH